MDFASRFTEVDAQNGKQSKIDIALVFSFTCRSGPTDIAAGVKCSCCSSPCDDTDSSPSSYAIFYWLLGEVRNRSDDDMMIVAVV